ncbi:Peptidylprolyl isomerase [Sergentomyia squamirostris]
MEQVVENEIDISGDGKVKKLILKEGVGVDLPSRGCRVSLHYRGTLLDGTQFDSSIERNVPFEFELGRESVIKAFDMGVATMRKGEKCILTCAPEYAYGAAGSGPNIPPNATLKFELEMLEWELEDLSPEKNKKILRSVIKASEKKGTPNAFAHVHIQLTGHHEGREFEEKDVKFNLGEGGSVGVVSGIEVALEKFHQYETSRLIIKPDFAFGAEGNKELGIPGDATVEYVVTLLEYERAPDTWSLGVPESLEQAKLFKEKGISYIKAEQYRVAIKMFDRSNDFLGNCPTGDGKDLKTAVFLNKALCYQKLSSHYDCKLACNAALELDDNSVKAYYRRGLANVELGDLEKALEDFTKLGSFITKDKL